MDIKLQVFHPQPTSCLDHLFRTMCPVRALKIYLDLTRPFRGPNRALCLYFDPDKAHRAVSKATMGRWLTEVIRLSYTLLGREHELINANPHSVRSIASSWAEIARASPAGICGAAAWLPLDVLFFYSPLQAQFFSEARISPIRS